MLSIKRYVNRITLSLVEDERVVKEQRFTYPSTQDAMAHQITAKSMQATGFGYVAISNYLTYGVH